MARSWPGNRVAISSNKYCIKERNIVPEFMKTKGNKEPLHKL